MIDEPKPRQHFVSLRLKLLVAFTLLFSFVFAGAYYWFYQFATELATTQITSELIDTMQGAASGIDGDQLQALYQQTVPRADGYTFDARYWQQARWLAAVKRVEPRAGLYTYIKGDKPGELIFLTSGGALNDPPSGAQYLERWVSDNPGPNLSGLITTTLQDKSATGCVYQSEGCVLDVYTDTWGVWVSAFTPIKNSAGEVVAGLGVDFRADYVRNVQNSIRDTIAVAFVSTYAILFLMVLFVATLFTRPITTLTLSAEQIGEGNYEETSEQIAQTIKEARVPDETTRLASVFLSMIGKIYNREQTLRRQVEELKIEIDDAKRQKEVGDIVESEFFKDLQAKARTMRHHTSSSSTPTAGPTPEEPKP